MSIVTYISLVGVYVLVELVAFNWTCANVLIDAGDSFSKAGGKAFMKAAEAKNIKVQEESFKSESKDMEQVIQKIIKKKFCKATVIFGAYADYSTLLMEAHNYKPEYCGEWIMGSNFGNGFNKIRYDLEKSNISSSDIDNILNGLCGFT